MSKYMVTDEFLYQYVPLVDEAMIHAIEQEVTSDYKFSNKFKRKMRALIKWERRSKIVRAATWISRRAAIFFIAVLGSALVITMSVKAYRIRFLDAVKKIYEDYIEIRYAPTETDEEYHIYSFSYIPDGYTLIEEDIEDIFATYSYENERGKQIYMNQYVAGISTVLLDSEYDTETNYNIDEYLLKIQKYKDGAKNVYYEYGEYVFLMTFDDLSDTEIIKMVESLK